MPHRGTLFRLEKFASHSILASLASLAWVAMAATAFAVAPPAAPDGEGQDDPSMRSASLAAEPTLEWVAPDSLDVLAYPGLSAFLSEHGEAWEIIIDRRSNRPHLLQGSGIPLIPGAGNELKAGRRGEAPTAATIETELRALLERYPGLLGERLDDFRLDAERSFAIGDHWNLELEQMSAGVPVEGSRIFARLTAGNITQLGALRAAPVEISTAPSWSEEDALHQALGELGLAPAEVAGKLTLLPAGAAGELPGLPYEGAPGFGWKHRLAWTYDFMPKREDGTALSENALATWRLRVDAHSGEVLEFLDRTRHADATAEIAPNYGTDPLVVEELPHMEVGLTPGGTVYTDANGFYVYPGSGTQAAGRLFGTYVKTYDYCGSIWLGDWSTGDLHFPLVPLQTGTFCPLPGSTAGDGNTTGARTSYLHLTEQSHDARCRFNTCTGVAPFPDLATPFHVNTSSPLGACNGIYYPKTQFAPPNIFVGPEVPTACNASDSTRSVLIHEWGHFFDHATGGPASEEASGEAFADTFSFIETGDGCIGRELYMGLSCANCDPACTGVRDLPTFSLGGPRPIARPSTIERTDGLNCAPTIFDPQTGSDYIECPVSYSGPMGYQGHCESHIASTANWDLRESLRARWGVAAGETLFENLWWETSVPAGSAYRIAAGGQCNPEAAIDGCGAENWYRVLLQMDDDNGNLADGTPNACRIFDAYAAHGIACGSRPPCTADAPGCAPPPASMRAWWPMDSTTANWTDELMAQNNAVLHGDPQVVAGQVGPALSFDGDDYLAAQDCQHLDIGTSDFTLLAWVRTTDMRGTILSKRTRSGSNYVGYHLELLGGRPILQIADPASNWINFYATNVAPANDGDWHLVAASVDRNLTGGARISIDAGTPHDFTAASRNGSLSNSAELRIGRAIGNAFDNHFVGDLDEVKIIHRALSQAEIQAIFDAGPSGVCTSPLPTLMTCTGGGTN